MSTATTPLEPAGAPGAFAPRHPADRYFFPALLAFLWLGLLAGFIPDMQRHTASGEPAYLPIVHLHAAFFVGWMLLITAQMTLVRTGRTAVHRRLGTWAGWWAGAMVLVSALTAYQVDQSQFGTPRWLPQFFAIQLADLVNFALLVTLAVRARGEPAAHRRLMFLAVTAIGNAGFGRWWGPPIAGWLGDGIVSEVLQDYGSDLLIVALMLAFDLATRGRVHPALAKGAALLVSVEMGAELLYFTPAWSTFSSALIAP